ncbi:hypothetical protein K431DRAFT_300803 [Polychaeton citri CBS 116435]|uniref:Uncharacterized protein n=1 Tax=Polychaeton citri CBS 116435 TaxID=1314669 RepID=A0A9P4UT84_9PEZI|nr:hypothetical protein K431DRAFT_300803 [Polychaeton citri CBS 116435]
MFIPPVGETDSLSISDPFVYIAFFLLLLLSVGFVAVCLLTRHSGRHSAARLGRARFGGRRMPTNENNHREATMGLAKTPVGVECETRSVDIEKTEEMTFGQTPGKVADWITMYHWRRLAEEEREIKKEGAAKTPVVIDGPSGSKGLSSAALGVRGKVSVQAIPEARHWRGYQQLEPVDEEDTE